LNKKVSIRLGVECGVGLETLMVKTTKIMVGVELKLTKDGTVPKTS